ncbi:MAG: DUF86 domain-containing protein [Aeromicrobium sp.]|uniref:HepT-like ribonuclease domain-containing protein n=1 Tax=Aeromicrobium sp. TaxID=1871063 RepID=UPI0039E3D1D5
MRRDWLRVHEALGAIDRVIALTDGATVDSLSDDATTREALLWNFTVLGESLNSVDNSVKDKHPDIPWRRPAALRNRIVHGYWSADLDILLTVAHRDIHTLQSQLRTVLTSLSPDSV